MGDYLVNITDKISNIDSLKVDNDDLSVFFDENYLSFVAGNDGKYAYVYSESFIIPVVLKKKFIFRYSIFCFQPYSLNNGGDEQRFLNDVVKFLKTKYHIGWINPVPAYTTFNFKPTDSIFIPFGNNVIDLTNDLDTIFQEFDSKHRNVVKKAEKDGVTIKYGVNDELLDDYYCLEKQTWQRSGKSGNSIDYYWKVLKLIPTRSIIFVAYYDEIPQASAIFFYDKNCCYYMYGASANKPHTGSSNYLHWMAINIMKNKGVKKYSFVGHRFMVEEGSKYEGIQRFKTRFGGNIIPGFMFKVICNKRMYKLFKIVYRIKAREKYIDPIDDELSKWKNLDNLLEKFTLIDAVKKIENKK